MKQYKINNINVLKIRKMINIENNEDCSQITYQLLSGIITISLEGSF